MQIRLSKVADAKMLAAYYRLNASHFGPWEPERESNYYAERQLRKRLRILERENRQGSAASFLALTDLGDEIIAHCTLSNILYGPMRACYMGYGISKGYEGRGIMLQFCQHVIAYAFDELLLNRIMANCMPKNQRSGALLERLGFTIEGTAKRYLKINGAWEDHVLTSLLNPKTL